MRIDSEIAAPSFGEVRYSNQPTCEQLESMLQSVRLAFVRSPYRAVRFRRPIVSAVPALSSRCFRLFAVLPAPRFSRPGV
jgi:hypothetical protein